MADLQYPRDLASSPNRFPAWINFSFFERKTPEVSVPSDKVDLYMPETIEQPSTVSWGTEEFGFIGAAMAEGGKNLIDGTIGGAAELARDNYYKAVGGAQLFGARAGAMAGSSLAGLMGGNVTAEGLMGKVAGIIPNPFLSLIFKGVDFRSFTFVFKFYPYDEEDCQQIYDIIKTFRKHALPTMEGGGGEAAEVGGRAGPFLGYPNECEIRYMWMNDHNKWLHRFKRAHCVAIDVNYTGQGMFSIMRNGFPSEIVMSTKWTELAIVTREDVLLEPGESF